MPIIYGPAEWLEKEQVCVIHGVPMLPCSACLSEKHPGIQVMLTKCDRLELDLDPDLKAADLMPADHPWLIERLV